MSHSLLPDRHTPSPRRDTITVRAEAGSTAIDDDPEPQITLRPRFARRPMHGSAAQSSLFAGAIIGL